MKKYFTVVMVFISCSLNVKAQTLRDSILNIDFNYYLNKPIDSLINKLPASYDSIYTRAGGSTFVGATVIAEYGNSNNIWVYIYPGSHDYFAPVNAAHNPPHIAWPLNLVKKEKAWRIIVWGLEDERLIEICCGN